MLKATNIIDDCTNVRHTEKLIANVSGVTRNIFRGGEQMVGVFGAGAPSGVQGRSSGEESGGGKAPRS